MSLTFRDGTVVKADGVGGVLVLRLLKATVHFLDGRSHFLDGPIHASRLEVQFILVSDPGPLPGRGKSRPVGFDAGGPGRQ
jgi:hypothetical protein